MKNHSKTISTILTASILISLILPFSNAKGATFNDLNAQNQNYTAIQYLAQKNILVGYGDGTFRPDQTVTRAEFLKIVLKSSGIPLDIDTPSNFKDTHETEWYDPYLRKAKNENWINGYADGTFGPNKIVNLAEGLKIIAAVQEWQTSIPTEPPFLDVKINDWYAPNVAYAKTKNFLEETGQYLIPTKELSRGKTSEILFRTLITHETNSEKFTTLEFTPVPYQKIETTFFENVSLDEALPNIFYHNEVYNISGTVKSNLNNSAFFFLKNNQNQAYQNFQSEVDTNNRFSIQVIFRQTGNFKLGFISGLSGQSKVANISVLPTLPNSTDTKPALPANNLNIKYQNRRTTVSWNNQSPNDQQVFKITFSQNNRAATFFSRQQNTAFNLDYPDFKSFDNGFTTIQIQNAISSQTMPLKISGTWSNSANYNFNAIQHNYLDIDQNQISMNHFPENGSVEQAIIFSGVAKTDIFQEAAIIKPDGNVETIQLTTLGSTNKYYGSNIIPSGHDYTFQYTPHQVGVYFLELNEKNGSAVINIPYYVQTGIPFIPDLYDTDQEIIENIDSIELARNNMLNLTNESRNKMGITAVKISQELNLLAQAHADDMANNNYFNHINLQNQTPEDRRIIMKINTSVGENIAKTPSLAIGHFGLMRSAIHRRNIIDPQWSRVGIGIAKASDNSLIIVEEFSSEPLTGNDLIIMKNNILETINAQRKTLNSNPLNLNLDLSTIAENWSNLMVNQNFFNFSSPNGTTLNQMIQLGAPNKTIQGLILESSDISIIKNEIIKNQQILENSYQSIGIGAANSAIGIIKITLLLSNP